MLFVLRNQSPQRRSSVQQYPHSDPMQEHFRQAFGSLGARLRVGVDLCECWLLCLFLSLIILPLCRCPLRSLFFPLFFFHPCFSSSQSQLITGFTSLPQSRVLVWQPTFLQGLAFCFVRGLQFPYITFRIAVLFDYMVSPFFFFFFLSFCMSLNLWIRELQDPTGQKLHIALCLELAVVHALSQMNGH